MNIDHEALDILYAVDPDMRVEDDGGHVAAGGSSEPTRRVRET